MSDHKIGKCRWCGDKGELWLDTKLCDTCDSDTIHCGICRRRYSYDNKCRHVFQSHGWGEWLGSGVWPEDQDVMPAFHRLLSAMGEDFARDLKTAIKNGGFHTWMVAPMIGGGGSLTLYGMPLSVQRGYGDWLIDMGSSERADVLHDGYCWLVSLYNRNTMRANRTTVGWIDRWLWPLTP